MNYLCGPNGDLVPLLYVRIGLVVACLCSAPVCVSAANSVPPQFIQKLKQNEMFYRNIEVVMRTVTYSRDAKSAARNVLCCEWSTFLRDDRRFFINRDELLTNVGGTPTYRSFTMGFDGAKGWTSEDFKRTTLRDDKPPHPAFPCPHNLLVNRYLAGQSLSATLASTKASYSDSEVPRLQNDAFDTGPTVLISLRNQQSELVRIWISTKYNHIPVKVEVVNDEKEESVIASGEVSDWSEIAPGVWFPLYSCIVNHEISDVGMKPKSSFVECFMDKVVLDSPVVPGPGVVPSGRTVQIYRRGNVVNEYVQDGGPIKWKTPAWQKMIISNVIFVSCLLAYGAFRIAQGLLRRKAPARHHAQDIDPGIDPITREYIRRHPDDCAYYFVGKWQMTCYALILECALYGYFKYGLVLLLTAITFAISLLYVCCITFRLFATGLALAWKGVLTVTPEQLATLRDEDLPIYTVLVPLYKEANIANKIIARLEKIDYPKNKLDVKLVLEEDDTETIEALRRISLRDCYELVTVGHSQPKTKPKACNYGLAKAKGKYVVIFDAEDGPEPDQLKKSVYAFGKVPPDVVCLQAKLNYRNARQNLLTRWFTIEYTMWFDLLLPGLQRLGAPIPLGGTSNHFKTDVLVKLDGWDPFNVTEDCDLGIRICKAGYRTQILESTTWEEANSQVRNWINQRSRWIKGFFQTHIAHMRNPRRLIRELGLRRVSFFILSVGGVSLTQVLNLVFWIVAGGYLLFLSADLIAGRELSHIVAGHQNEYRIAWKMLFWGSGEDPFWSLVSISLCTMGAALFLANFLFIVINCLACKRRGNSDLLGLAILSPLYWVLISIAAWKGFLQLFIKRFYWEKTVHGLEEEADSVAGAELIAQVGNQAVPG